MSKLYKNIHVSLIPTKTQNAIDMLSSSQAWRKYVRRSRDLHISDSSGVAPHLLTVHIKVLLQNCHLFASWMPKLDKILEQMDPKQTHAEFRCASSFMSCETCRCDGCHGKVRNGTCLGGGADVWWLCSLKPMFHKGCFP